ncbi:hypothetical protein C8Q79DRAFT_1119958 [Trametes meyenii]|nr:hypothetical protein C8Q79DRAFT_1119958 [Trametes meyenii]
MYARAIQTLTLLLAVSFSLVSATPAPIDPQQANVIAENHNVACSGPQGCAGVNGTIDASSNSATSPILTTASRAIVVGAATAGGLSVLGLL